MRPAALMTLFALATGVPAAQADADAPARYATTPMLEPDRCATAWTIQRVVDPDARIEFHPRESMPEGVILFDLPEASLKRDARRSTLEALIDERGLTDPFVLTLARLIHDIEINAWARRDVPTSALFERLLMTELRAAGDIQRELARCLELVDGLRRHRADVTAWAEEIVPSQR